MTFRSADAEVLVTPVQAPGERLAERWVGTVRAECLDWLLIVGRGIWTRRSGFASKKMTGIVRSGRWVGTA
jgi:hypothetical protein